MLPPWFSVAPQPTGFQRNYEINTATFIKRLKIRHFRSFEHEVDITFQEGANVISGSNGSGKTSVLQAAAFVLNSGRLFDAASDGNYINQDHRAANPESAWCAVTAVVANRIGQEFLLEKSIDVGSRVRYRVSDMELTEAEYEAKLKELCLFADFHIIPQDMVTRFSSINPSELGKLLESFFLEGYTLEFTAQEDNELKGSRALASNLRKRIAVLTKTVEQIRRLSTRPAQSVTDIEEELQRCERRLNLAELWGLDEKMKEYVSELRAVRSSDVEARRAATEAEIEVQQTELRSVKTKLEDLRRMKLGGRVLEEKIGSRERLIRQLAISKKKLRDLLESLKESASSLESADMDNIKELLVKNEQMEASIALIFLVEEELKKVDEAFHREHGTEAEELGRITGKLVASSKSLNRMRNDLYSKKAERFLVEEEIKAVEDQVRVLEKEKRWLGTELQVYVSYLEVYETTFEQIEALRNQRRQRLNKLRDWRRSLRRRPQCSEREEFEIRCFLNGVCKYLPDEVPSNAIYGLLRDLIKPKTRGHERAFRRVLGGRYYAVVARDEKTRESILGLLAGDESYRPPACRVLCMKPNARRAGSRAIKMKKGVIPLQRTWMVSAMYARLKAPITGLIRDLTLNIFFCNNDNSAKEIGSAASGGRNKLVRAVTADGTLCSNNGTLSLCSSRPASEVSAVNSLMRREDIQREMRVLATTFRGDPEAVFYIYKSLVDRQQFLVETTRLRIQEVVERLERASANKSALRVRLREIDENLRISAEQLERSSNSPADKDLRQRRKEINSIRLEYIRPLLAEKELRDAEISDALEHTHYEAIGQQDLLIRNIIELIEQANDREWRVQLKNSIETHGRYLLNEISARHGAAENDEEQAKRDLLVYRSDLQQQYGPERELEELFKTREARLLELLRNVEKLSSEARRNSLKEKSALMCIEKLRRAKKNLLRRLAQEESGNFQGDDGNEMELEVEAEGSVEGDRAVDYSDLPQTAKGSEKDRRSYVKSLKDAIAELRSEKLGRIVRRNHGDVAVLRNPEARLREKTGLLHECKAKLSAETSEIKRMERRKAEAETKRREALKAFFRELKIQVTGVYNWLTDNPGSLSLKVTELANGKGHTVKVEFKDSSCESLSGGETIFVSLSIAIALQEMIGIPLLILDEIDAKLSSERCHKLGTALLQVARQGKQVICITHRSNTITGLVPLYIGLTRCPIRKSAQVISFDPVVEFTEDDCVFTGPLDREIIDFIKSEPQEDPSAVPSQEIDFHRTHTPSDRVY